MIGASSSPKTANTNPPITPASRPPSTVSPVSSGTGVRCCIRYVVMTPPVTTQRQQQQLPICTPGSAERMPMNNPPSSEGWYWPIVTCSSVVVFATQVRDEFLAAQVTQRVLQL